MIETGTRVVMDSDGETYEGVVTEVGRKSVARTGRGSGMNQADRNGIDTRTVAVCTVRWDGIDGTAEYREDELRTVPAGDPFEDLVDQVDEATQCVTGRPADRRRIRAALRAVIETAQLRGQADAMGVGFFRLLAEEPFRVPQLVRSATSGRVVDVVIALVAYGRK